MTKRTKRNTTAAKMKMGTMDTRIEWLQWGKDEGEKAVLTALSCERRTFYAGEPTAILWKVELTTSEV